MSLLSFFLGALSVAIPSALAIRGLTKDHDRAIADSGHYFDLWLKGLGR